jgi:hypothetical protein
MLFNLREDSPLRPPDWRWKTVISYRESGDTLPRSRNDCFFMDLFRFSERLDTASTRANFDAIADDYPEISHAYDIYKNESGESSRWELEARLLTNQTYRSISENSGISTDVIETFERAFFNVKERLAQKSWVLNCAIGRSIYLGLTDRDYDLLWKTYAYYGGSLMLDVVMSKLGLDMQVAETLAQAKTLMQEGLDTQSVTKASTALAIYPVNGFTAQAIVQIEQAYRQMAKDGAGVATTQAFFQSVDNIMSSLPWSVGTGTIKHPVLSVMGDVDTRAAELRVNEMISVANGDNLSLSLETQDLRLPEPEAKNGNE